jgi:Mycothiol maleylpyruvate isomerase N-terminal domain
VDRDAVWQHIDTERAWLADLLEALPEQAWNQDSLCHGWSVRDGAELKGPIQSHLLPLTGRLPLPSATTAAAP